MFVINAYTNYVCPFYPCHNVEPLYCNYCFCPLYKNKECGGNVIIHANGCKDCSHCTLPHTNAGREYILKILHENIDE